MKGFSLNHGSSTTSSKFTMIVSAFISDLVTVRKLSVSLIVVGHQLLILATYETLSHSDSGVSQSPLATNSRGVAIPTKMGKPIMRARVSNNDATVLLKTAEVNVTRHTQKIEFKIWNRKPNRNHFIEMESTVSNITIDEMKVMAKVKRNRASLSST